MALALPMLIGLAAAPLLGGRWSRLRGLKLRWRGIFYAAIALQLVAFPFRALPWSSPDGVAAALWLCSYALLAVGVTRNLRLTGLPLIGVGMLLNLCAIIANGGRMPALPAALRAAGMHFSHSRNSVASAAPHLSWLVDRWAAPGWVPYANVFSVGDVLIAAGGLVVVLFATGALPTGGLTRLRPNRQPLLP